MLIEPPSNIRLTGWTGTDLERRTLPAAEEDAPEADLARPRINREKAGGCGGVRRSASPGLDDVSTIA
jgi:hypothetical protein